MNRESGTTKETLQAELEEKDSTLLRNPDALRKLRMEFEHWQQTLVRKEDRDEELSERD